MRRRKELKKSVFILAIEYSIVIPQGGTDGQLEQSSSKALRRNYEVRHRRKILSVFIPAIERVH